MTTRLTLATYLASWDPGTRTLAVNLLIVPDGNPLDPLGPGLPAFVNAILGVVPKLYSNPGSVPGRSVSPLVLDAFALVPPTTYGDVIRAIDRSYPRVPDGTASEPPDAAPPSFKKHLPDSYRAAFAFSKPSSGATLSGEYRHAVRCGTPLARRPRPEGMRSFNEALAFLMRQPAILRAAGMLYRVNVGPLPAELDAGGWLVLELDPARDYGAAAAASLDAAVPEDRFYRTYLTRIPALPALGEASRALFTAVLFPYVSATLDVDGPLDEAMRFDDGFAKIVHATQPTTDELHQADDGKRAPSVERGIRVAWDDEDVLAGMNRNVARVTDRIPRGISGYRIDVREQTSDADAPWHSLSAVVAAELRLDGLSLGRFEGELRTDVTPRTVAQDEHWLPPYFTTWRGGSLVTRDALDRYLTGKTRALNDPPAVYEPVPAGVELRYGHTYELRVRMVDGVGGGPALGDKPAFPGPAPVATVAYRRYVPLGRIRSQRAEHEPAFEIARPLLGYPAIVHAAGDEVLDALRALRDAAMAPDGDGSLPALPDPDAARVEIRVLVRGPAFDPNGDHTGYRELFTTICTFPPEAAQTLVISLVSVDVSNVDIPHFDDGRGTSLTLRVPSARDVKIEFRALGAEDAQDDYFAGGAERGAPTAVEVSAVELPAANEPDLFVTLDPPAEARAVFSRLEPDSTLPTSAVIPRPRHATAAVVERLAAGLGVQVNGATLIGPPGQRVVFGCSGASHRLAPDHSALSFLAFSELVGSWACALRVDLQRDWTWRGLSPTGIRVERTLTLIGADGAEPETEALGSVQVLHSVNATATEGDNVERSFTTVLFVDVFPPRLFEGLPYEIEVTYTLSAELARPAAATSGPSVAPDGDRYIVTKTLTLQLPVVTPPATAPKIVAVGHAQSPFVAGDNYGSTERRSRMLWIELDQPIADSRRDGLFARVLARAPDPLLLADAEAVADPPPYPDLPIDQELARVIVPGRSNDHAGAMAMQALIPGQPPPGAAPDANVHFLVPLPPGTHEGSPDLLGFFSYEFRFGHRDDALWTTARGRFGPALVLDGVQHPAPELVCSASRGTGVVAHARFAVPYYHGRAVPAPQPSTDLWIILYAQVPQADGSGLRNVQIDVRRATPAVDAAGPRGDVTWDKASIRAALGALGLPDDAPLSVLAVELLPEPMALYSNPLGTDLGEVRILRTTPLVGVGKEPCANWSEGEPAPSTAD